MAHVQVQVKKMISPEQGTELGATAITSSQLIKLTGMAAIGAVVHSLIAYRKGETKSILDVFLLTIISAFGGLMGGLICLYYYPADEIILMIGSGMGGYLGVEGLTYLVNYIKSKIQQK